MMVKFGASMFSWIPRWSAGAGCYAIGKASDCGFDLLEISLPPALDIDVRTLRRDLLAAGMEARFTLMLPEECHLPFYPAKALEHLKAALDIVEEAGGNFLGGVLYAGIGVFTGKPRTEEERKKLTDVLSEAAAYAACRGIVMALEPINRYETYLLTSAREVLDVIRDIASPGLCLMLDTFHMNIEENGCYKPVTEAGKALRYMHLAGSDRGMPGEDNVHWDDLFRGLAEIRFTGDLVLENFSSHVAGLRGPASLWRESRYDPDTLAAGSLAFFRHKAAAHGLVSFDNSLANNTANLK